MSNANESAYPVMIQSYPARDGDYTQHASEGGLTKREMFAMAAMQGLLACTADDLEDNIESTSDGIADYAVECADALLDALERST